MAEFRKRQSPNSARNPLLHIIIRNVQHHHFAACLRFRVPPLNLFLAYGVHIRLQQFPRRPILVQSRLKFLHCFFQLVYTHLFLPCNTRHASRIRLFNPGFAG